MNTTVNDDPLGGGYWVTFTRRECQATSARNAGDQLYDGGGFAIGGPLLATPAEPPVERIAGHGRAASENGTQE